MRLLLLISTIVIGASFSATPSIVFAGTAVKSNKHTYLPVRVNKRPGKAKRHISSVKPKNVSPGDVWARISSGIRLPLPSLEQAVFNTQQDVQNIPDSGNVGSVKSQHTVNKLSATISPESASDPMLANAKGDSMPIVKNNRLLSPSTARLPKNNYTALGRKLLGQAHTELNTGCESDKKSLTKHETINSENTRVHAQFNVHPEFHKHTVFGAGTVAQKQHSVFGAPKNPPCAADRLQKLTRLTQTEPGNAVASSQAIDTQMQLLAKQQRALEAQQNAGLAEQPIAATENKPSHALEVQLQLVATKQRELEAQRNAKLMLNHERVNKFINWYSQRRDYLYEVAERARPYLYHIVEGLSSHHLPLDLALLPIVESAYQPKAQSPMSAAGLWQFIPSTGADYNLKQDPHYDERLDIAASTQAAISYLSFLKQRFKGDWLLALAAYNCGIGRVEEAISRNIAAGLDTDYWSLQLPEETQEYVPRLLALATLFANPAEYKLKLAPIRNELYFINVKIDRNSDIKTLADKDIKTIAQLANINYEQFSLLNPGFLKSSLPPDRPFSFLMPIRNANQLHLRLTTLATIQTRVEDSVPSFSSIATVLNESAEAIMTPLVTPFISLAVDTAMRPVASVVLAKATTEKVSHNRQLKSASEDYSIVHYLDKGETLNTVAKQFDVSVEDMRKVNKLKRRQNVVLGQRLIIPAKRISTMMLASRE